MRWFTRRRRARLPSDPLLRLELFGRYEFDPHTSGIASDNIYQECLIPFLPCVEADRVGFLVDLRVLTTADQGGFATFGAARLVWELYGEEALRIPAAHPLIDAGIDFKLARGLPSMSFTGYETRRVAQRRDTAD